MSKRLTTQEFIERAREVHGDKYDYRFARYKGRHKKIKIICPEHGEFWQTPGSHYRGSDCPKCANEEISRRYTKTTNQFIRQARQVHGNKYDYSQVVYQEANEKVTIICLKHGPFNQTANSHLQGCGCPECDKISRGHKLRKGTRRFIEEARIVHGDRFSYDLVTYTTAHEKVTIVCPQHGQFEQSPASHLRGTGCPYCGGTLQKSQDEFIEQARQKFGNRYDYSKVIYKSTHKKVIIVCPKHGPFKKSPVKHLAGQGCPHCKKSTGEEAIADILKTLRIPYRREYTFDDCRNSKNNLLPFDFYLPTYHALIEYDGEHHFRILWHWGGKKALARTQRHDSIKNAYAATNNIPLLRIAYTDFDRIEQLVTDWLASLK